MDTIHFLNNHKVFTGLMITLNIFIIRILVQKININLNRYISEAMGGRGVKNSLYGKCINIVRHSLEQYERRDKKAGFYLKAKMKMKKSGYKNEYAALWYIIFKYLMPVIFFLVSYTINYPEIIQSILTAVVVLSVVEAVVMNRKRRVNLKFQRNTYKIYKYLHNQISSGIKVTDAIKTVYEVIEDRDLKDILIQLAARYELTMDIDISLEEFKSNFDMPEAETLCIALKQGIMTGDNAELLARQEEVMFKKYFNYIQAETDSCKTKSVIVVAVFAAVIVTMIAVPMLNDITDAVGKIFIN